MILIVLLYFLLIIFSFSISKIKYNTILRPNTLFTLLWGMCGILSISYDIGTIVPGIRIHIYIIVSIITFNITYFSLVKNSKIIDYKVPTLKEQNYKLIILIWLFAMLLVSTHFITAIQLLFTSGFNLGVIRDNYSSLNASGRDVFVFLTKNIPSAIFSAVTIVAANDLVNKKYKLLPIAFLSIITVTITFGGRFAILNAIIYYFASYIIQKKYRKIKIRRSYIFIAVITIASITILRDTSGISIFDMGFLYYVGSLSFLELILQNPTSYGLSDPLMYGYLTLGFIFEPIVLVLKFFLGVDIDIPGYHFNIYAQVFANIGESHVMYYNNNTTIFYTFLRDFGEIGIVLGTAFIAVIISASQKRFEKHQSIRSLYILMFLYSVIFNSSMMYTMTSISSSLLIIFLIIFSTKIRW